MTRNQRLALTIFCISTFLTIFVNYNSVNETFSKVSDNIVNIEPLYNTIISSGLLNSSSKDGSSSGVILDYRSIHQSELAKIYKDLSVVVYEENENDSASNLLVPGISPATEAQAPAPLVTMNESADDEKILNNPLSLPHRNNSITCTSSIEHNMETKTIKRASFTIVVNFIKGNRRVKCDESITYSTHSDFRFLDNLIPLVERWEGPVSISLYAPLGDLKPTIDAIIYLRECTTPLVKEWITFHVFGDTKFFSDPLPFIPQIMLSNSSLDPNLCSNPPAFGDNLANDRTKRKLLYPVNVARNVARQAAMTHYVLASDIELYPSRDVIPMFLDMIKRNESKALHRKNPRVFALPVFEIKSDAVIPDNKDELISLIKKRQGFSFHRRICSPCHRIPMYFQWLRSNTSHEDRLDIFHSSKRLERFKRWEPIFIGTNDEPLFDERLSWEGLKDKMTQNYILCVLDYDYMILDNAFLVHKPGIKVKKHPKKPDRAIRKQNRIFKKIKRELENLYEKRDGCEL